MATGRVLGIESDGEVAASAAVSFPSEFDNGNQAGPSWTLDWNDGQKQRVTLTGNITTLTLTAPSSGVGNFLLKIVQDATGSRTITWPASVRWPSGAAPNLSTTNGAIDIITFYYDGTNYYAVSSLNFS